MKTLVTIISGQIDKDEMEMINGVVLSVREKHLRLNIWCADSENIEVL